MSEFSTLGGNEGYEACDDERLLVALLSSSPGGLLLRCVAIAAPYNFRFAENIMDNIPAAFPAFCLPPL